MPTIHVGQCVVHGETLFTRRGCCSCHPCEVATPKPVVFVRRAKKAKRKGNLGRPASVTLTDREQQIASLAARGFFQHEIATALGITRNSVQSSVKRAMERVGAANTEELYKHLPKVAV